MSMLPKFTKTPEPPYYVVIFSSQRTEGDNGYTQMAERVVELAAQQPGFLGVESVRGTDGFGITVSYWASAEAIVAWKANVEHLAAQEMGKQKWYEHYELRVAKVERAFAHSRSPKVNCHPEDGKIIWATQGDLLLQTR